jgi:O-antigen ligase
MRRPATRKPALAIGGVCVAGLALAWILGHSMIQSRLQEAQREIKGAQQEQVYWTSAGLRLGLWGWAIEVWRDSPIIGVGAGGFPGEYQQLESFKRACENARERAMIEQVPGYAEARAAGRDVTTLRAYRRGEREYEWRLDYLMRGHAHSTYLHNLASEGAVGLVLLLAVLLIIARQCLRDRADYPYSDAMFFVLLSWVIGAQFDCYELNGHQLGLLTMIAALTLPGRAKVRWQCSAIGD